MQYVLTNAQMREADEYTIRELGVPALELMERAGTALADEAERLAPTGKILCVCGGGNNGGDGFVCARILSERGRMVDAVCSAEKFSPDCLTNKERWTARGAKIFTELPDADYALAVDCLFGTGFHGGLNAQDVRLVNALNEKKTGGLKILAADIPSGVDGKDGSVQTAAVNADVTLCLGEVKTGVLLGCGVDCSGAVKRADIGISRPKAKREYAYLIENADVRVALPKRTRYSHKGRYGSAAIVAGSAEYTGAAFLSAAACLRSGAGYTTLFVPKELLPYYVLKAPEILLQPINDGDRVAFKRENFEKLLGYTSIAYGMGMGVSEDVARGAAYLLRHYEGRLILDADGLNSLAAYAKAELKTLLCQAKSDVVLTPHVKEFSRLCNRSVEEILQSGLEIAKAFAKEYGVTLLLKNAVSILTDGTRVALNATGNSGQAKGGSGDVLSGVLAGVCAMGADGFNGSVCAAYLTGRAAELATQTTGEYSLTASDVISYLGGAFLFVLG